MRASNFFYASFLPNIGINFLTFSIKNQVDKIVNDFIHQALLRHALTKFENRVAVVTEPTPPGTGVIAKALLKQPL